MPASSHHTTKPTDPYPVRSPIIVSVLSRSCEEFKEEGRIRQSIEMLLNGLKDRFGDAVRVMVGGGGIGDQLVALAAKTVGIPRIDVVSDLSRFGPSGVAQPELCVDLTRNPKCHGVGVMRDCWWQVMEVLLGSAHVIVTFGDEKPAPVSDGLVDTAWVPSDFPFYPGQPQACPNQPPKVADWLDRPTPVPWLQITGTNVSAGPGTATSACVLHVRGKRPSSVSLQEQSDALKVLPKETQRALDEIHRLNNHMVGIRRRIDKHNFSDQLKAISVSSVPAVPELHATPIAQLRKLQAGVDAVARGFQRWLLGVGVPARDFSDWLRQAKNNRKNGGWMPSIGVLFIFCLLVPLIVGSFELYAHMPHFLHLDHAKHYFLLMYVIIFLGGIIFYVCVVKPREWQNQFQDYRAYAEALRVQIFWSLAGIHDQVGNHYLHKHRVELGWIRFALRGVMPWTRSISAMIVRPARDLICEGWIVDQQGYFARASLRNHHSAIRSRYYATRSLYFGLAIAVALLVAEILVHGSPWCSPPVGKAKLLEWFSHFGIGENGIKDLHHLGIIVMGLMPAITVFFGLSSEMRAFEGHAQGYDLMNRVFSHALDAEAAISGNDDAFKTLVFELGREAINENAGWLMDHRHRPIENRVG